MKTIKKPVPKGFDDFTERCASCGRNFRISQLSALSDAIMQHKPACSYECNVALGQVHKREGS